MALEGHDICLYFVLTVKLYILHVYVYSKTAALAIPNGLFAALELN